MSSSFKKVTFKNNQTYLPVTMKQFEDLTNEIMTAVNVVADPFKLDGEYVSQILMSAIHALKHEQGVVQKSDLFYSVINRISCHVTFHVAEETRKRLEAKKNPPAPEGDAPGLEVVPELSEAGPASVQEIN